MNIIYLHGLDSCPNATKAQITHTYATQLGLSVHRPDLNCPPDMALSQILELIQTYPNAVLIGSSLGGYFATLASDLTGVSAVLLNPSIRPDVSFQRFLKDNFDGQKLSDETIIYSTTGGWDIKFGDLAWFEKHRLQAKHGDKLKVFLALGDELLDAYATQEFYQSQGAFVFAMQGGDHRISDYERHVGTILDWVQALGQHK